MKTSIKERLLQLRQFMQNKGYHAFIIPSTDPHSSEYTPLHWESRKWISGFTGSAGTVVITLDKGGLWTDSRYFLQAADQLEGTGITLFKERMSGTPSIPEWLGTVLSPGNTVAIDGWVMGASAASALKDELKYNGLQLALSADPFTEIWKERPQLPETPVFIHELKYTGIPATDKIAAVRSVLTEQKAEGILLTALDDIAWTLNLRGNDVHCNPVFVSYLLITHTRSFLYILPGKINEQVAEFLSETGITVLPYDRIAADIEQFEGLLLLPDTTNYALYSLAASRGPVTMVSSPVEEMKAVKNETETEGFRQAMLRDGVAMVKFLKWLKETVSVTAETEVSIDRKLHSLRAEQALFQDISFDTIAGYQEHGAIVHYEATEETASVLRPEGLLLLDSGAQYLDGTTDITRTIVLGPVTDQQKTDYTLVLKGMIQLSMAVFPEGTYGTQLDILARQFMWKEGINYWHGTGHGVGHYLSVHEGPHQIRMNHIPVTLRPGMTVTNEPGIYRAGQHGVRIENTMIVRPCQETSFGSFYQFETLTLCPIDKEAIAVEMLSAEEKEWLNQYHSTVYSRLAPLLNTEEQAWLADATSAIE